MNFFSNPALWLGALSFRANRLESYEALEESLLDRARAAPVTLRKTFERWAERDLARGDLRGQVFAQIERRLSKGGNTFATAIRPFVPDDEFLILSSGDLQGDVKNALGLVIRNIKAKASMNETLRSAMLQPAMGLVALLGLSFFSGIYLWPEFLRAIPRKFWPGWTLPCVDVQLWLVKHWYVMLAGLVLVGLYYFTLSRWTGKSRDFFDRFPPWSIYKARQASSLLGVLAALVGSGRTVRQSFVLVQDLGSPYMAWHLRRMLRRYDASGEDAMSSMRTGFFSKLVVDRVEDAAGGRTFEKTLSYVGENSMKVILRIVSAQAQTASMAFMLVIGVLFVYINIVSVFGIQEAADAYIARVGGTTP